MHLLATPFLSLSSKFVLRLALLTLLFPCSLVWGAELKLDTGWRFYRGDVTAAEATAFDDSDWRVLDIPHDWSIEDLPGGENALGPHDPQTPDGSDVGYMRGGVGWYRRVLGDAERPAGDGLELILHGTQQECDIWINGRHVAFQAHGYVPVRVEIGPYLRARPQPNLIAVRVANPERNSRWYSGSGLYRAVSLRGHGPAFIPTWGARMDTLWLDGNQAGLQARVQVRNDRRLPQDVLLEVEIESPDGSRSAHPLGSVRLAGGATECLNALLRLKNVRAWSPGHPSLYRARFRVREGAAILDEYETRFGVRTIAVDAERGLLLNGVSFKLRGANLHHDNGLLGARAFPDADRRRVRLMKANGFNAIRTAHNPPSIAFLDACDEEGLLVIDEFADSWQLPKKTNGYQRYFDAHAEADLALMVARDFNHPSVIMWSIGNEIPERFSRTGVSVGHRLAGVVRREDPRRFVTASVNHIWEDPSLGGRWEANDPAFSVLDIGGYNYAWQKYREDHERCPARTMYGAESYPKEALQNWNEVERLPYVLGDFVWAGMDYIGESGIGHTGYVDASAVLAGGQDASHSPWPVWNAWCGDLDLIGDKKPQSLYRDVVWGLSPLEILVHEPVPPGQKEKVGSWGWPAELPTWNWTGQEGRPMKVSVYTRAPHVRLELNGRLVGEQDRASAEGISLLFEVPWESGVLTATASDSGKTVARKVLKTTGPASGLRLQTDSAEIRADRAALVFVSISIVDSQGLLVSGTPVPLAATVTGEAELCAFGSGDPAALGSVSDAQAKSFRGRALAILRSSGKAGVARLTVRCPGLPDASVDLAVGP